MAAAGVLQLQVPVPAQVEALLDTSKLLLSGIASFYNNPLLSDVTLVCPDGREIHSHQVLLASASKRLAMVFQHAAGDAKLKKLPVQGVDSGALQVLVQSWYTGQVPLTLATAPAVYDCASKLDMPAMLNPIEQFFTGALTPGNCCGTLERCLRAGAAPLAELAVEYIKGHPSEVMMTAEFKRCAASLAVFMCKELAVRHSQVMGVQATVAWLTHNHPSRSAIIPALAEAVGIPVDQLQAIVVKAAASGLLTQEGGGGSPSLATHIAASASGRQGSGEEELPAAAATTAAAAAAAQQQQQQQLSQQQTMQMLSSMPQLMQGAQLVLVPGLDGHSSTLQLLNANGMAMDGVGNGHEGGPALKRRALAHGAGGGQGGGAPPAGRAGNGSAGNGAFFGNGANGLAGLGSMALATTAGLEALAMSMPMPMPMQGLQGDVAGLPAGMMLRGAGGGGGGSAGHSPPVDTRSMLPVGSIEASAVDALQSLAAMPKQHQQQHHHHHHREDRMQSMSALLGQAGELAAAQAGGGRLGLTPAKRSGSGGLRERSPPDWDGPGSGRGGTGGGSSAARKPLGNVPKGRCHVEGCTTDISALRDYYQRYKICEFHLKVSSVLRDGVPQRFCQQCGRFQALDDFDGERRSCRVMLQKHCNRRQKTKELLVAALAAANAVVAAAAKQQGGQGGGALDGADLSALDYETGKRLRHHGGRANFNGTAGSAVAALRAASVHVSGRGGGGGAGGMGRVGSDGLSNDASGDMRPGDEDDDIDRGYADYGEEPGDMYDNGGPNGGGSGDDAPGGTDAGEGVDISTAQAAAALLSQQHQLQNQVQSVQMQQMLAAVAAAGGGENGSGYAVKEEEAAE